MNEQKEHDILGKPGQMGSETGDTRHNQNAKMGRVNMANNWGQPVGVIALSKSTELHILRDAEMDGKKFLVLSKYVKTQSYSGPAKGGSLLIPMEKLGELKQAIDKAHAGQSQ